MLAHPLEARFGLVRVGVAELEVDDAADLSRRVLESGVIVRATGQKLVMSPPFVIERDQVDRIVSVLADEAFTPDSSRFWPSDEYEPGRPQPSFDKQFARDYCETVGWDKTYPGPELPAEIVEGTRARYVDAFERLTEISFDDYLSDPEVVLR